MFTKNRCCFLHFFNLKTSLSDSEKSGVKVVACTSVCEKIVSDTVIAKKEEVMQGELSFKC